MWLLAKLCLSICLSTCTNLRIKIFKGFNIGRCHLALLLFLYIVYNLTIITNNLHDDLCKCFTHFEHKSPNIFFEQAL